MNTESKDKRIYKKKKRTFIDSVKNCLDGINYTITHENNFKREMILGIIAVILSAVLKISILEWVIVLLLINFVLVCELINTALEKAVDLYTKEFNETAKIVKDVAGATVLVMCIFSAIIGAIIFIPKILVLIK